MSLNKWNELKSIITASHDRYRDARKEIYAEYGRSMYGAECNILDGLLLRMEGLEKREMAEFMPELQKQIDNMEES